MIGCEFDLAPEELLYSAIARFRARMRYPTESGVWGALHSAGSGVAVVDLPGRLREVVRHVGAGPELTAERLVRDHTTLPYYAPFVDPTRAARAADTLVAGSPSTLYGLLGIRASTVPTPTAMRYCVNCAEADRAILGAATWKRSHQLPGVVMCDAHDVVLRLSTAAARTNRARRPVYLSVDQSIARSDPPAWTGDRPDFLKWAAEATAALLSRSPAPPGLAVLQARYHALVQEAGHGRGAGRIAMAQLREAFVAHHGRVTLRALGCALGCERTGDDWLARILRRSRSAQHPLHHLLLLHFLSASPGHILVPGRSRRGGGSAPAPPCRNPVCPLAAARGAASQTCTVERYICPRCGYSYRRVPGGHVVVQSFGPLWEDRLRALVTDPAFRLRPAARALGVDPKTLKRRAALLGVSRVGWDTAAPPSAPSGRGAGLATRERHRTAWRTLRGEQPDASIQALRSEAPSTYSYLYRYDRAWLDRHRPPSHRPTERRERVDWAARDLNLLRKAKDAVRTIISRPARPVRLSAALIGRTMGQMALVEQHLDRLPRTRTYLASVIETRAQHARRRLRWTADRFTAAGEVPEPWALAKAAGLRTDLAAELRQEVLAEAERIARLVRPAPMAA